jgi:glutamate 5-kinase
VLVLLSDVDALYTRPPSDPTAEPILEVPLGDPLDGVLVGETHTGVGTGGARTKVAAARAAAAAGVGVLLTSTDRAAEALTGAPGGTWFEPAARPAAAESPFDLAEAAG